jgi:uncharacterized phage protein (TIGR01671 family)
MREIKFRAWSDVHKTMYYDSEYIFKTGGIAGYLSVEDKYGGGILGNSTRTMQYTGLKDNKGQEIYEGDIVRFGLLDDPKWDRIGAIGYSFAEFTIISLARKYPDVRLSDATRLEVIGNIYQHPEFPKEN